MSWGVMLAALRECRGARYTRVDRRPERRGLEDVGIDVEEYFFCTLRYIHDPQAFSEEYKHIASPIFHAPQIRKQTSVYLPLHCSHIPNASIAPPNQAHTQLHPHKAIEHYDPSPPTTSKPSKQAPSAPQTPSSPPSHSPLSSTSPPKPPP